MNPQSNEQALFQKITPEHLTRTAIVYLRQSNPQQVKHNKESQRLQYALADRARSLGFHQVQIIDRDLGSSAAAGAAEREGFKQVLADVAMGTVGIVFSRELSRLSRTDKDWCHLMELCQIFNTLVADADNLYDLSRLDDQLVLGIKGTLSVVELKTLKLRMQQGVQEKARRGELVRTLPPGYVCDAAERIVKDPNLRIQEAIELVFKKFRELGSARQTYRWFHEECVELPVNQARGGRFELIWKLPTLTFITDVLHNPLYAGAYVYGRRQTQVIVKNGRPRKRQGPVRPIEQAHVFLQDHHPSYIDWVQYEANQKILRRNAGNFDPEATITAVRAGHGLLTGLLRCARCGRKLHIRYWGRRGTAARYLCHGDFGSGGKYCLGFGGASVDQRASVEILKALEPLALQASLAALKQCRDQHGDQRNALLRQRQQVEYEAERAFDQYNRVEPSNRLVAQVLEQRWNEKLQELARVNTALEALAAPTAITDLERAALLAQGEDFAAVWNDPACPRELKKKIARTLIQEIVVDLNDETRQLRFIIHWHGGCHTAFEMPKPMSGAVAHKTALEDLQLITRMAPRYQDDEIARVLSKLGRRTGKGHRWTGPRVAFVRKKYALAAALDNAAESPILTLGQATRYCGVSDTTLMRLIRANVLAVGQVAPYAPLEIKRADLDSEPVKGILERLKATGKLQIQGDTSATQQSLFELNQ